MRGSLGGQQRQRVLWKVSYQACYGTSRVSHRGQHTPWVLAAHAGAKRTARAWRFGLRPGGFGGLLCRFMRQDEGLRCITAERQSGCHWLYRVLLPQALLLLHGRGLLRLLLYFAHGR